MISLVAFKRDKGFTMIEVLVASIIIAVLVAIGVVSYASINRRSRDAKRKSDLEQMRSALEMFRADYGAYPAVNTSDFGSAGNLNTGSDTTGLIDDYMNAIPTDPLSTAGYYFQAISVGGTYVSYCICANLEAEAGSNSCSVTLPITCNYGTKNP
ncbi:prepilin-type N-terminal cleavage/methylation domain-containing protein [Candidatus Gottesmanbacteria bacterium]|nr:prepilin-type N-terminal cleavage/methylation domain-containing protein [Candidatus Gottesmanbacteria bacterium]